MILKEWSEAQQIYKATLTRWCKALRSIHALRKVKSYWYVWGADLAAILALVFFALTNIHNIKIDSGQWIGFVMWFVAPIFLLLMVGAREKAFAKEFADDYATHAIASYSFWSRDTYFTYALFLHEIQERKYSHEKVARLSDIAELATPPDQVPFRFTQNPIITYFMVVFMALIVNFITTSPVWQSALRAKVLVLGIAGMLLGGVMIGLSLWYPVVTYRKNRHQRIQRYLQWAERDLKEDPLF